MNKTKAKREKIQDLIDFYKDKFDDSELSSFLNTINAELNRKKYGLVWEEHSEEVLEKMKTSIPVFSEINEFKIKSDNSKYNFILEGDNLHSLHLLTKTHRNKINVIYIDPPYNTGNNDFIYDDKYVNSDDGYLHSKWLSFMFERLKIAKQLLSEDGVIFISIDDNEQAQLKLLCDEIFGKSNFIANSIRKSKAGAGHDSKFLSIEYDYTLIYAKNIEKIQFEQENVNVADDTKYRLKDEHVETRGKYYLRDLGYKGSSGKASKWYIKTKDGSHVYSDSYGREGYEWRWGEQKYKWGLENDFIVHKKVQNKWRIYIKQYQFVDNNNKKRERYIPHRALMNFLNNSGTSEVREMLGSNAFSYPKPKDFVKHLIALHPNKNSLVLDFFAGSGTTGHAVLELNKEDTGDRKFILCTNNQNNIAREVTYERINKAINGYTNSKNKKISALQANLKYFTTEFIDKENKAFIEYSDELLPYIKELVEIENGIDVSENNIFISDEDGADQIISSDLMTDKVYLSTNVLLTNNQKNILNSKGIDIIDVPDYYFMGDM